MLKQVLVITALNFRGLRYRLLPAIVIVVGMACVVGVLLSISSLIEGLQASKIAAGDPRRAIVLSSNGTTEAGSSISREAVDSIRNATNFKESSTGIIVDPEIVVTIPAILKNKTVASSVILRGVGTHGQDLHPEIKLIAGRMFQAGRRELIAGVAANERFSDLSVGDTVLLPDGDWPIVGVFTADRNVLEGNLMGDAMTLMPSIRRKRFNSVLVQLKSPDEFGAFKSVLTTNPALSVSVERQSDYYVRNSDRSMAFFKAIASAVTIIMSIGALLGALNIMYGAVAARLLEIATLRAVGFSKTTVAVSLLLESALLCLVGALSGGLIAWFFYDGTLSAYGNDVFRLAVSLRMIGVSLGLAVLVGILGAAAPAIYASRLPVAAALRAT